MRTTEILKCKTQYCLLHILRNFIEYLYIHIVGIYQQLHTVLTVVS